jgi:hypothetical protein
MVITIGGIGVLLLPEGAILSLPSCKEVAPDDKRRLLHWRSTQRARNHAKPKRGRACPSRTAEVKLAATGYLDLASFRKDPNMCLGKLADFLCVQPKMVSDQLRRVSGEPGSE